MTSDVLPENIRAGLGAGGPDARSDTSGSRPKLGLGYGAYSILSTFLYVRHFTLSDEGDGKGRGRRRKNPDCETQSK